MFSRKFNSLQRSGHVWSSAPREKVKRDIIRLVVVLCREKPCHGNGWIGMPQCPLFNSFWKHAQSGTPGLYCAKITTIALRGCLAVRADLQRALCWLCNPAGCRAFCRHRYKIT
jgi:hypothetical protein